MQPRTALRAPTGPESSGHDDHAFVGAAVPAPSALTIVALSEDPTLLEALTHASLSQAAIITSPSADRFVDQLMANGAQIALVDALAAPLPLEEFIAGLRYQFPQLLLLVAGAASLQHQLRAQIADGAIFRYVHKPASAQRLKLFVEAALRRRETLEVHSTQAQESSERESAPSGTRAWIGVGALLLLSALALAAWWGLGQHGASEPLEPAAPVAPSAAVAAPVAAPAAKVAARTMTHAAPGPNSSTPAASSSAPGPDAHAQQAHVYIELARARLASGALLAPTDDSARDYVRQALALSPDDSGARAAAKALGEALIAQVRQALTAGDADAAQRWLKACADYQINPATLGALSAQLESLPRANTPTSSSAADAPSVVPAALPSANAAVNP